MKTAIEWMRAGKSERSATLCASLDYLAAINGLMRGQPTPDGQRGTLSEAELNQMDIARVAGMTPDVFVARILAKRPAVMRVVCSWCSAVLVEGTPGAAVSHGICDTDASRMLVDAEEMFL